jgi:hypothetical protein
MDWSQSELDILNRFKDESYEELEKLIPNRTKRAIKHKVVELKLNRVERRKWSDEEMRIVNENPTKTAKELMSLLPKRSEIQIAFRLRSSRGSARRMLKKDWAVPSKELAYLIGAWCSDGCVQDYSLQFSQHERGRVFLEEVGRCIESVFGLGWKLTEINGYLRLTACSREYKEVFSVGGLVAKPDWVELIDKKYPWIWSEEFFWYFIGGVYDGDGSLAIGWRSSVEGGKWVKVCLAVKPSHSRERLIEEFAKRGMRWVNDSSDKHGIVESIALSGGQIAVKEFIKNVRCILEYKRTHDDSGIWRISREEATVFLKRYHYLGDSLRPGVVCFAGVRRGEVMGVVCFGSPISIVEQWRILRKENADKVRELTRFAVRDDAGKNFSSSLLAQALRKVSDDGCWAVISYADESVGHIGTLYQAANAYYLGKRKGKHRYVFLTPKGEDRDLVKGLFLSENKDRIQKYPK